MTKPDYITRPDRIRVTRGFEGQLTEGALYAVVSWEAEDKPRVKGDDGRVTVVSRTAWETAL